MFMPLCSFRKNLIGRIGDEVERDVERPDRRALADCCRPRTPSRCRTRTARWMMKRSGMPPRKSELGPRDGIRNTASMPSFTTSLSNASKARVERNVSELRLGRHAESDEPLSTETEVGKDADAGKGPHAISGKADLEVLGEGDRRRRSSWSRSCRWAERCSHRFGLRPTTVSKVPRIMPRGMVRLRFAYRGS